jgi:hypothetical protein
MVVSHETYGRGKADAIVIPEKDAFAVAFEFLRDWKPISDV